MATKTRTKLYFAVEVTHIHGNPVDARSDPTPAFVCYSGSGADAQIQEEGCFVITDNRKRHWFCREITQPDQQQRYMEELFRMGFLAHKLGINEGGRMFHGGAADKADLRERLSNVD